MKDAAKYCLVFWADRTIFISEERKFSSRKKRSAEDDEFENIKIKTFDSFNS